MLYNLGDPARRVARKKFKIFFKKAVDSAQYSGNLSIPFDGDRINRFAFFPSATGSSKAKTFPLIACPEKSHEDF